MSRHDDQRLADILASTAAINNHTRRGGLDDGLVFDAARIRLIEIGEAVKSIDPALLAQEPDIPWIDIAGMRNHLAHRYFDTAHSIVAATVARDLPPLHCRSRTTTRPPDNGTSPRRSRHAVITQPGTRQLPRLIQPATPPFHSSPYMIEIIVQTL